MTRLEEMKEKVTTNAKKAAEFCKTHKNEIKDLSIFVGGAVLSYVFTRRYYTPKIGDKAEIGIFKIADDGPVGYQTKTFNKYNHERKQIRRFTLFNNPEEALRMGENLVYAATEWSKDQKRQMIRAEK